MRRPRKTQRHGSATKGYGRRTEAGKLLAHAGLLYDGKHLVHLHDAGGVLAHNLRDFGAALHQRGGELIEGDFVLVDLVVSKVVGLQDVDLLGDLLDHLLNGVGVAPGGDGVFMHTGDGGGGHIEALNIDLLPRKNGRHLVEQTGNVL